MHQVVQWIVDAGMYAVVNIHWDGGWIRSDNTASRHQLTSSVRAKFESYWQQIADALGDADEHLIFEALNEEGEFYVGGNQDNGPDYAPLNELNQLFVTTVRATGGHNATRGLLIAGFSTDIEKTCVDQFTVPRDPAGPGKLFLSLHYYTPPTFCLLETVESWGSPKTTWGNADERAELARLFKKAADFAKRKGVTPIIGEFAVAVGEKYPRDPASRALWMGDVVQTSLSYGMVPMLWDTGAEVERKNGSLIRDFKQVMAAVK